MDFSRILHDVAKDKNLVWYLPQVREFLVYLRTTSQCQMVYQGARFDGDSWIDHEQTTEYLHRFTTTYRRAVISKFYQLENWYQENPTELTMLTLTTYQEGQYSRSRTGKGYTIPKSFEVLKTSWNHLRMALRTYIPGKEWTWIMEPHLSGYPHLHVVIFDDLDRGTQAAIRHLWTNRYQAGSWHHGADFSIKKPSVDNSLEGVLGMRSLRNYLLKYVAKGFTSTGSKFGEGDDWTAGQMVFYALTWKNSWRLFGASRNLCKVMAYNKATDERTEWYRTAFLDTDGEEHEIWKAQEVNDAKLQG